MCHWSKSANIAQEIIFTLRARKMCGKKFKVKFTLLVSGRDRVQSRSIESQCFLSHNHFLPKVLLYFGFQYEGAYVSLYAKLASLLE